MVAEFCNGILVQRDVVFISFAANDILTSVKRIFISVAKHYSTRRGQRPFGNSHTHTHPHTSTRILNSTFNSNIWLYLWRKSWIWMAACLKLCFISAVWKSFLWGRSASQHSWLLRLARYLSLYQSKCRGGNEPRKWGEPEPSQAKIHHISQWMSDRLRYGRAQLWKRG